MIQIRKITVSILFFLACTTSLAAELKAQVIYVPDYYNSIQTAIDAASDGDSVVVREGTYYENVVMKDGVDLVGVNRETTIIDGSGAGPAVAGANRASITGFTITNSGNLNAAGLNAAGIHCSGTSPTINYNIITGNKGPGISLSNSRSIITNNIIDGNHAYFANAIDAHQSSPTIFHNIIRATDPNWNIAAIYTSYADTSMTESFHIEQNIIVGVLWFTNITSSSPLNNIVKNNIIVGGGNLHGGIQVAFSETPLQIVNNTIAEVATGISAQGNSHIIIKNNIVSHSQTGVESLGANTLEMSYNDIWGNTVNYSNIADQTGMDGNMSIDPLYQSIAAADFHLRRRSRCINAGDPLDDYSNEPQPNGNRIDMGAYGNTSEATSLQQLLASPEVVV